MVNALTMAGSDSGGGAGIQADLKAMASLGVHGCTVITCITDQNTQEVRASRPLPLEAVEGQFRTVVDDIPISAAKTGMLYSPAIVELVARLLAPVDFPTVVDPVMVATVGDPLSTKGFRDALLEHLLPRSYLLTPNLDEAAALVGRPVGSVEAMERAARSLHRRGARNVLIKGGHLRGQLVDVLFDGRRMQRLPGHRFPRGLHGSGCVLGALITAGLALGKDLGEAIGEARRRVAAGFETAYRVGEGVEVINASYSENRYAVWEAVRRASEELASLLPLALVPEVGINIGYALPGARALEDVCGLSGRIMRVGEGVKVTGPPAFGASRHVARIILAALEFDPSEKSAANIKYGPGTLAACRRLGLRVGTYQRAREPPGVSTMEWGTSRAIRSLGRVPDIIYDLGSIGKVPMIRVLGRDPEDVVSKVRRIVGVT